MDALDLKILKELDWNCRQPFKKIARKTRSNKDVVNYRIKRLEEKGVLGKYYAVINMYKLGYHTCRFYFDLQEMNQDEEKYFVRFLDEEIESGLIFRMDYPYKYGVVLWVKSVYEIENIIIAIKRKLGRKLISYNHTLFCSYSLYPKDYLFSEEHHKKRYGLEAKDTISYDEEDFAILQELAKNARETTTNISKTTDIPQSTVSHKIKQMEKKGIILGYRADINYIKLGYMNYFLEIYLHDNNDLHKIEAWAHTHKNTVWLQRIIGTSDIEIEVEIKDRVSLEKLLIDLRSRFSSIRKIIFWSQEYKKLTFLPKRK